jgi:drug efflux transport system permease protein
VLAGIGLGAFLATFSSLTLINPVRHFATTARGIMLKGAGVETLYPNLLALIGFAVVLVTVSAWRFRKQLG